MPITVSGTQITFNDATTQTTAAGPSAYVGDRGQVFTSSGTFTIPTGVTAIKVSIVGGGGGGGVVDNANGSGGGTSSVASGTQSISTRSATGGQGANQFNSNVSGSGSGGDLNLTTTFGISSFGFFPRGVGGASSGLVPGGAGGGCLAFITSLTPGNTLTVTVGSGGAGAAGAGAGTAGVVVIEF